MGDESPTPSGCIPGRGCRSSRRIHRPAGVGRPSGDIPSALGLAGALAACRRSHQSKSLSVDGDQVRSGARGDCGGLFERRSSGGNLAELVVAGGFEHESASGKDRCALCLGVSCGIGAQLDGGPGLVHGQCQFGADDVDRQTDRFSLHGVSTCVWFERFRDEGRHAGVVGDVCGVSEGSDGGVPADVGGNCVEPVAKAVGEDFSCLIELARSGRSHCPYCLEHEDVGMCRCGCRNHGEQLNDATGHEPDVHEVHCVHERRIGTRRA